MSTSRLRSIEMRLTWIAAASAGGCCLCSTWRPPHSWKAVNGSSGSVATSLAVPGRADNSRCATKGLRCRDDLISGSPDEQDWSLVSGGREEMRLIITSSTGFHTHSIKVRPGDVPSPPAKLTSAAGPRCWGSCTVAPCTAPVALKDNGGSSAAKESCSTELATSVGLTPAVRHDLEGQRQEVIKGRIQHHCFDVWVRHHCPRGYENKGRKTKETELRQAWGAHRRQVVQICRGPSRTCESSYGPGIYDDVAELEAQLLHRKLNDDVHGVGLALGEGQSLAAKTRVSAAVCLCQSWSLLR